MNRLALLIGADYGGLLGVRPDLVAMTEVLEARGYTVTECPPAQATRAGILAAYEKIIADARPDDSVVVYYSGHGDSAKPPETGPYRPADLQYILPMDFDDSSADDFRGIAAAELSVLQSRLTTITRNVTVILDCCYSGRMSRDTSLRLRTPRGVKAPYAWVRNHLDRLHLPTDLVPRESNDHAVRVVACAPDQRAYERADDQGVHLGLLTRELTRALAEAGDFPVTWAALLDLIRTRLPEQRPEAEGPADRVLFTTDPPDLLNSLPVTPLPSPTRVQLDGAALLQVQDGDEFLVMPPGRTTDDQGERVGVLTIDHVGATSAAGTVALEPGCTGVPVGARAFRTRASASQFVVRVPGDDPRSAPVREALRRTALARPAEDGEAASAEIHFDDSGGYLLSDRIGPLHPPYPNDDQGLADLTRAVLIHARATQLRQLADDPSAPLGTEVTVEWGLVEDGVRQPPPEAGRLLAPRQRIFVTVHNRGDVPVYVSMLDIGLSGRVSLLMRGTPSGRLLPARTAYTYGYHDTRQELTGAELSWPKSLDPAYARTETILVVITSEAQSLAALEQPEIVRTRSRGGGGRLRDLIDQIAAGGSREVEPDLTTGVRYAVHAIDFDMTPSDQREHPAIMMTPDELRQLCTALRNEERVTDSALVERMDADIQLYRDKLAAAPTPAPPAELAERLPLMGWLIYETSWDYVKQIPASFDGGVTAPADRVKAEAALDRIRQIADCARTLPWPEYAPRALGALRALALAESKRDTEPGYDAAWLIHGEVRTRATEFRDSYGSREVNPLLHLRLDEVFVQLALAETGTACRAAERVVARWAEDFEDPERPDWSRHEQERWIPRMFRQLSDGVAVGELAIRTLQRIRDEVGFTDRVNEHRFTRKSAFQNPGIMTARAASLLLALRRAMQMLGLRQPPEFESWDVWETTTLDRFRGAYRAIEENAPGDAGMDAAFQRQLVHVRLNLALLKPGFDLRSQREDMLPCLAVNPLSADAVEAMSAYLGGPRSRGRERGLGAATMPLFIRSLVECRGAGPDDRGYQTWRITWFSLDHYSTDAGRLDRVRWALDAAA